jgi:NitT/TauT family transport system substrate-binding protein
MQKKIALLTMALMLTLAACAPAVPTPTELTSIDVCYSANSASTVVMWYAQEEGLFEKYGLEVNLEYISSGSSAVAALIAGDVDICMVAGAGIVNAVAADQDAVMIAGLYNKFIAGFFTTPDIQSPEDLIGKTLAISRPGSSSTVGTLLTLDAFGLTVDKDVTLLSVGNDPERFTAMKAGQVSGAVLSPPSSLYALQEGYTLLFDLAASEDIDYQFTGLATRRAFIESDRETVINFMKAIVEASANVKANPEATKALFVKYLELDPATDQYIIDGSYELFIEKGLESVPYPTLAGLQTIIDASIETNPDVANITPEDTVDMSIVAELEESGFIAGIKTK